MRRSIWVIAISWLVSLLKLTGGSRAFPASRRPRGSRTANITDSDDGSAGDGDCVSTATWPSLACTCAINAPVASFNRRSLLMTPGATLLK